MGRALDELSSDGKEASKQKTAKMREFNEESDKITSISLLIPMTGEVAGV